MYYTDEEYLAHHGILGQKWGVRRYQNKDGSLTTLGKKRRGYGEKSESKIKKAIQNAKEKASEKKVENEATKHENLKRYVRNHPKSIYRHRMDFSQEEINKLVEDIRADRKLKDIRNEEIQRGWDKVKTISNNIGTIKNFAENAKGVYNLGVEINNLLVDTGKTNGHRMNKIGEKPEEDRSTLDAVIKSGNAKAIRRNLNKMSSKDLETAMKNIKYIEQLDTKIETEGYNSKKFKSPQHLKHCLDMCVDDILSSDDYLEHHGILGQKWGVRRYQNEDGSLTEAGKARYASEGSFTYPSKKRGKQDVKIYKKYWEKLEKDGKEELNNIKQIKDKDERIKAEEDYLRLATGSKPTDNDIGKYIAISKEYNEKSGNWYNGTSVSNEHKRIINEMRSFYPYADRHDDRELSKLRNELDKVVLKDIGFEDTPENRKNIRYVWQID